MLVSPGRSRSRNGIPLPLGSTSRTSPRSPRASPRTALSSGIETRPSGPVTSRSKRMRERSVGLPGSEMPTSGGSQAGFGSTGPAATRSIASLSSSSAAICRSPLPVTAGPDPYSTCGPGPASRTSTHSPGTSMPTSVKVSGGSPEMPISSRSPGVGPTGTRVWSSRLPPNALRAISLVNWAYGRYNAPGSRSPAPRATPT